MHHTSLQVGNKLSGLNYWIHKRLPIQSDPLNLVILTVLIICIIPIISLNVHECTSHMDSYVSGVHTVSSQHLLQKEHQKY